MNENVKKALLYFGIDYNYYKEDTKDAPDGMFKEMLDAMKTIEDALEQKEKQDKVLAILEGKRVDISLLVHLITSSVYDDSFVTYNNFMSNILTSIDRADKVLTEEEFNLIKEWLNEINENKK